MYPILCRSHQSHCEDCGVCRNFDRALKEHIRSYDKPPPASHPTVVTSRVKSWISKLFGQS